LQKKLQKKLNTTTQKNHKNPCLSQKLTPGPLAPKFNSRFYSYLKNLHTKKPNLYIKNYVQISEVIILTKTGSVFTTINTNVKYYYSNYTKYKNRVEFIFGVRCVVFTFRVVINFVQVPFNLTQSAILATFVFNSSLILY